MGGVKIKKCRARSLEDKDGWGKGEWVGQDVVHAHDANCVHSHSSVVTSLARQTVMQPQSGGTVWSHEPGFRGTVARILATQSDYTMANYVLICTYVITCNRERHGCRRRSQRRSCYHRCG